ncbi:hypothetical protein PPYR_14059 [Photinus pyralis]|uniref:ADP-ribosylation factor-like protein 13B n=1 Tax=Photinus pyralis TaxID=7054 RepID=A0A5N4A477_PHOPY|nr:hypothetical protein PPYR_14059 [Photinus pyralis]
MSKNSNRVIYRRKIVLLLVGLDNAGKSVAVKGLAGEPLDTVMPTVGLSVTYLKYGSYSVKVFDLGGGPDIRGIWQRYFVDVHGVIFVVDSSDYHRLDEARDVLNDMLSHEKIRGKPILLLANKQDRQEALDELDIVEKLELEPLVNSRRCPTLVETCAATDKSRPDPGIQKGYHWLINFIIRNYPVLNTRVEQDVRQQRLEEQAERLEKIEKLRKFNEGARVDDDLIESYSDYDRKLNGSVVRDDSLDESKDIFYIRTDYINRGGSFSSSKSNDSFPCTYHTEERPKSAVQWVKNQLANSQSTLPFVGLLANKTTPVHLYGVHPQSASERRRQFVGSVRTQSAGARVPTVDGRSELFHLNNFHVPGTKENGTRWAERRKV